MVNAVREGQHHNLTEQVRDEQQQHFSHFFTSTAKQGSIEHDKLQWGEIFSSCLQFKKLLTSQAACSDYPDLGEVRIVDWSLDIK